MHWIDLTIMVAYILASVGAGIAARGKKSSTEDYFTAEGGLNSWFSTIVVGLSIAGTFFSGISFLSYPSAIYSNGILLFVGVTFVCMPVTYVVLRYWFLPRYLGAGWKFPYDVIEARFGASTRTAAATLFILMRIGWMAAMIYAPTIAIMTMADLDDRWFWPIVLITGLANTAYTVISGIRGVIVSEAIQMLVISVGILGTIIFAFTRLPVSADVAWQHLVDSGHMNLANFSLDPKAAFTVWTIGIGVTVANLTNYIADQMSLQRYLATGSVKAASRSFAVNFLGVVVVLGLLTCVGVALFVYYAFTNDPTLPAKADQVFPHFVATRLPVGLAGLLLAALLAATSIPSGINTLAGVLTLDFHARLVPTLTDKQQLMWAKIYSLVIGLLATLAAGVVSKLGTLFDLTQIILGVFAGPLLACMVLAVSGARCSGRAVFSGMLIGWVVGVVAAFAPLASLWVAPLAAGTTLLASLVLARVDPRSIKSAGAPLVVPGPRFSGGD